MSDHWTQHSHTPLNPVAHGIIEDCHPNQPEEEQVIHAENASSPDIVVGGHQPASNFVVALNDTEDSPNPVTPPSVSSPSFVIIEEEISQPPQSKLEPLMFSPEEVLLQIERQPVSLPSRRAVPSTEPSPLVDLFTFDSLAQELSHCVDCIHENEPVLEQMEEDLPLDAEAPLLTFDDLMEASGAKQAFDDAPEPLHFVAPTAEATATGKTTRAQARGFTPGWQKTIAIFAGLAVAVVLPLQLANSWQSTKSVKSDVMDQGIFASNLFATAANATTARDFDLATTEFARAADSFERAEQRIADANRDLLGIASLLPETRKGRKLLSAGSALADAGATLTRGAAKIEDRTADSPIAAMNLFNVFLDEVLPNLNEARTTLNTIESTTLPPEYRSTYRGISDVVNQLTDGLTTYHDSIGQLTALLGGEARQRYLVVFQNNTEIRPSGGFIGSFAEVDILDGHVQNVRVPDGGSYAIQGQLTSYVAAPKPLQLVGTRWEFQDANWFADFPTSAKKIMQFYEQAGEPTVDGVIAVNATFVSDLIHVTGPIELPQYNKTIDSENFLFELQKQVEDDYDQQENAPKAIIGDMTGVLMERLTSGQGQNWNELAQLVHGGLAARDIQIYHNNHDIQSTIQRLGWTGEILTTDGDYLMVSHANIGGKKTDGIIDDEIEIFSELRPDGRIQNSVHITRRHNGLTTSRYSGANNVSFTRIFVPLGSTLVSVEGAEPPMEELFTRAENLDEDSFLIAAERSVYSEDQVLTSEHHDKSSFGAWMQTMPGEESTLTFTYLLPASMSITNTPNWSQKALNTFGVPTTTRHSMFIQKQPGVLSRTTRYMFNPGSEFSRVWPDRQDVWSLEENADGYFGMVLEVKEEIK